jgi:hypothetical protein
MAHGLRMPAYSFSANHGSASVHPGMLLFAPILTVVKTQENFLSLCFY